MRTGTGDRHAAATWPKRMASASLLPLASAAAKPPTKVSPAAVVSTALTLGAGSAQTFAIGKQCALGAEGNNDFARPGLDQLCGSHFRRCPANRLSHRSVRWLRFRWESDSRPRRTNRQATAAGRRRIEDHRLAQLTAALEGIRHGFHRHFKLADDHVGGLQHRIRRLQ